MIRGSTIWVRRSCMMQVLVILAVPFYMYDSRLTLRVIIQENLISLILIIRADLNSEFCIS